MSANTNVTEIAGKHSIADMAIDFSDLSRHSLEDRSVLQENFSALQRRWHVANDPQHPVHLDPKLMQNLFPDQRRLFEILAHMTLNQVTEIAQCKAPLFQLRFATGSLVEDPESAARAENPHKAFSEIESSCREENLMALAVRLDLTHQNETNCALLFGMQSSETKLLRRHSMLELRTLASHPLTRLVQGVTDQFFIISSAKKMDWRLRTAFARTSRRTS